MRLLRSPWFYLAIALSPGCNGTIGDTSNKPEQVTTLDNGTCDIPEVFARNGCTASGCHGATFKGGLDLLTAGVEERLVDVRSSTQSCNGRLLVDAAAPTDSLLLQVLSHDWAASSDACTIAMPLGTPEISSLDHDCIAAWVTAIAAGGGDDTDDVDVFQAVGPETYVAKVKTLVTGEAVTNTELALVNGDPAKLRELVEAWVDTPLFYAKLARFFEVTLQATTRAPLRSYLNLNIGQRDFTLQNAMNESVTRTALDIVQRGAPLNEIVTTHTFMVNTALLTLIAYQEQQFTDRRIADQIVKRGTKVMPLAESAATKTWVFPEQTDDCGTAKLREDELLQAFFGVLSCRAGSPNVALTTGKPLTQADFDDWRAVTFKSGSKVTAWYDLETLRAASTLVVRNPRVGFFTTPAFQMNWLTNDDNSYRVTINQTLIAALDASFSAGDPTAPLLPSGVDDAHAKPGTECYGCHKHMDPMRGYFRSTTDTNYAFASDPTPAAFSFLGGSSTVSTIDGFAAAIADHPRFAMAWVQKLCMWSTAHRCDESDPETQRIVTAFVDSGLDFKKLFVELMTSPLVTEASFVETFAWQPAFVSIARRDHVCSILRTRTGNEDICDVTNVRNALAFVPVDAYARGSTDLVQSTMTSPFHSAASERLCLALAPVVVAAGKPYDPASSSFVESIVGDFMGLPTAHSRHDAVVTALSDHIAAAQAGGANKTNASRSAFIAACVSADITALGI